MFKITINGKLIETKEKKNLLDFLRDDMDFIAVKNGCGEGALSLIHIWSSDYGSSL